MPVGILLDFCIKEASRARRRSDCAATSSILECASSQAPQDLVPREAAGHCRRRASRVRSSPIARGPPPNRSDERRNRPSQYARWPTISFSVHPAGSSPPTARRHAPIGPALARYALELFAGSRPRSPRIVVLTNTSSGQVPARDACVCSRALEKPGHELVGQPSRRAAVRPLIHSSAPGRASGASPRAARSVSARLRSRWRVSGLAPPRSWRIC